MDCSWPRLPVRRQRRQLPFDPAHIAIQDERYMRAIDAAQMKAD
jgi:hypothetical protein